MEPMNSISSIPRWAVVALAVSSNMAIAPAALAQVVPDETLPNPSSVVPGCTVCTIDGGTQQGTILFHSFSEFSVPTDGAAIFNNLETIENIFSRVTGDSISDIDGLLRTNGTASLFLLNPNGIIFGPNTQLDIGGSFTASTADSLIFANGEVFSAVDPEAPPLLTLSIRPGLQYGSGASANPATLTNRGNLITGQDLTLVADQLDIQGQLQAGENLRLIATDQVQLRDRPNQPLVVAAQDELWIRGDQTVDIFALNHPQSGLFSGGDLILQSENAISGDARYGSGGNFRISTLGGDLGTLTSPQDPVIRALGDVTFDTYIGSSLHVLAGGSVEIGTVTITQPETGVVAEGFLQETFQLSNGTEVNIDGSAQPTLDIRAGVSPEAIAASGVTGVDPGSDFFLNGPDLSAVATRADITVGDVVMPSPNGLVVLTNQYQPNTALAGGDIAVTGDGFFGFGIDVQGLDQPGGSVIMDGRDSIVVESVIDSSAVLADAGDVTLLSEDDIALTAGSGILANGLSGGSILLQSGGAISMVDNSLVSSDSLASTPAPRRGSITFSGESIQLSGEDVIVSATTTGVREGSPLLIQADDTVTLDGSSISTNSLGVATEPGGNITVTTSRLHLSRGGSIASFNLGGGGASDITLTANDSVTIEGRNSVGSISSSLLTTVAAEAPGDTGNISIATPQLTVADGGFLATRSFGAGNAGDVIIMADEALFDGTNTQAGQFSPTGIFTTASEGDGGDIRITGQSLALRNGALFLANTDVSGSGAAGNVILTLTESVTLQGDSPFGPAALGSLGVTPPDGDSRLGSAIFVNTLPGSIGDGGNIDITTRDFSLSDRAVLIASTFAPGRGGNITVDSRTFSITDGSRVSATSSGEGEAGNITVQANQFNASGAGVLSTATESRFDAGNIELQIRDNATFSGTGTGLLATTTLDSTGDGGNIRITGPRQISLRQGATIEANSEGTGIGGDIQLAADVLSLDNNAIITATTTSNQGGDITLTLQDALILRNGSQISTAAGLAQAGGDGGNITIDATAGFVVAVPDEDSDIVAAAFEGRGGNIRITAQGVLGLEPRERPTPLSDIRASSELGVDGIIEITTLNTDPEQGLVTLPSELLENAQLLAQGCDQVTADSPAQGEFYNSGRGGITPLTSDALGSDDVIDDLRLPETVSDDEPITEAQGWWVSETGEVVLTAEPLSALTQRRCWR
jgi:filamentous hemagglutinin family protein